MDAKFISFLNALKNNQNDNLIESVKTGYQACFETPIAYDEETASYVAPDSQWSFPPDHDASVNQVKDWVVQAVDNTTLTDDSLIGEGGSREVRFNDEKTVFKYNHGKNPQFGNQVKKEASMWNSVEDEWKDIITHVYDYGDNWIIQEYTQPLDQLSHSEIEEIIGIPIGDIASLTLYLAKRFQPNMEFDQFEELVESNGIEPPMLNKYCARLLSSSQLRRIFEFCWEHGLSVAEIRVENLGISSDGTLKLLDYGF